MSLDRIALEAVEACLLEALQVTQTRLSKLRYEEALQIQISTPPIDIGFSDEVLMDILGITPKDGLKPKRPTKKATGCIPEMAGHPLLVEFLATVPVITQQAWVAAYGIQHVIAECLKALAWMEAQKKPKTRIGHFMSNWLSRTQPKVETPAKQGIVLGDSKEEDWIP